MLQPGGLLYDVIFVGLIIFFCYFYTAVMFKTDDVSDNLKKYGGFIPGIRPGQPTARISITFFRALHWVARFIFRRFVSCRLC